MKREKNSNGRSVIAKIMYAASALLAVIFIYMLIEAITYIGDYMASYGMAFGDMWSDAIQYVLSSSISYLVFALLLFAAGKILDEINGKGVCCDPAWDEALSMGIIEGEAAGNEENAEDEAAGDDAEEASEPKDEDTEGKA